MFTPKRNASYQNSELNFQTHIRSNDTPGSGLFSGQGKQSINQTRTLPTSSFNQSSILDDTTNQHQLSEFKGHLPVIVTETLTSAGDNEHGSFKLDEHGYAWFVCGRRLIVWKYKLLSSNYPKGNACKELLLPPSNAAHHADLVTLLVNPHDSNQVAVIGISPEGIVRYWPSMHHERAFAEVSVELRGEECKKVIPIQPYHCVLATNNSCLIMLAPIVNKAAVSSKALHMPQSLMLGVGKRMSSFFFGGGSDQGTSEELLQLLPGELLGDQAQAFYVLTKKHIQKWVIESGYDRFLYQVEVKKLLKEFLSPAVWGQDSLPNLKAWLLDMQVTGDGVVLLGAGMNPEVSADIHYVLGALHTEGTNAPQSFLSFIVSKFTNYYQPETKAEALGYKLLLPSSSHSSAYLYDKHSIICLSVSNSDEPYETVDFPGPRECLLGGVAVSNMAVFYSMSHGLVTMSDVQTAGHTSITMNASQAGIRMPETSFTTEASADISHLEEMSVSEDKTKRLRAAFLFHCSNNMVEVEQILCDLFPEQDGGSSLDSLVAQLSEDMIDDYPSKDPRWADSVPFDSTSSSTSLILIHQLEEKLSSHELYINFLKASGLWDRLKTVKVREGKMSTKLLLSEHAEKVMAALGLRTQHTKFPQLVDVAIHKVLKLRAERSMNNLTPQDIFYREVSRIQELVNALVLYEEENISEKTLPRELFRVISAINSIIAGMLHDAWDYRQSKANIYQSNTDEVCLCEYVPWTASVGAHGMRQQLLKQHNFTVEKALSTAQDSQQRGLLFQQLLDMTDLLLDGYKCQLESERQSRGETTHYNEVLRSYEIDRRNLIHPFMEHEQYQRAASLAEKYCDFGLLVELCEKTGNQERLQRYMNQFSNKGFSDFVFNWYVGEGKRGKLMSSSFAAHPRLGEFLQTGDNKFMSWVHDLHAQDYLQAHEVLSSLSKTETQSLSRKKTLLSLSKLSMLASSEPPVDIQERLNAINDAQDLILHQEMLPESVFESLALDPEEMKVYSAQELIELYVGESNETANELDFKKSLDLLQFVNQANDVDMKSIILHIWCRALLRDEWDSISPDDPLENIKETVFFKTIQMAASEGMELSEYLPSVDDLITAEELGDLRNHTNFQYLVKAGYEQLSRLVI